MIVGTGIDIIEVERIKRACQRVGFLQRVYTDREREYFQTRGNNPQTIAGNFAIKEAVMKALGTGFGKVGWQDIEALRKEAGKPYVILHGRAASYLSKIGGVRVWVSISHIKELAVAQAIIEGEEYNHGCCNPVGDAKD